MRQTMMILGIVLLAIALAVVYFERKLREQNHKIASMFSLVSSLAEEVNSLKYKETDTIEVIHIGNPLIDVSDDELEMVEDLSDVDEELNELDASASETEEESYSEAEEESASEAEEEEEEEEEIKIKVQEKKEIIKVLKIEMDNQEKIEKPDFKKMNISELRSIATSKGMDAAKLKKSELIELLSN